MNISIQLSLTVLVTVALYAIWVWVRVRHLRPMLGHALEFLNWQIQSEYWKGNLTFAAARYYLEDIQGYQHRLWLFGNSWRRRYWTENLHELKERCVDVVNIYDSRRAKS